MPRRILSDDEYYVRVAQQALLRRWTRVNRQYVVTYRTGTRAGTGTGTGLVSALMPTVQCGCLHCQSRCRERNAHRRAFLLLCSRCRCHTHEWRCERTSVRFPREDEAFFREIILIFGLRIFRMPEPSREDTSLVLEAPDLQLGSWRMRRRTPWNMMLPEREV